MPSAIGVSLRDVVCCFGQTAALDSVSLTVGPGEFLVLLGSSGCGKTTLLRSVAGFQRPDYGEIRIGERVVSGFGRFVPPEDRALGIVFQSYALWPHMTVAENVGFGLHRHPDRRKLVADALATVGLSDFSDRHPATLSGGQRQRVALARCLAKSPGVILMDEPLANLDPELRGAMQAEFVVMHRRVGTTFLYVTHDRTEALALADRIALMARGRILQCDTPRALYERPATPESARLLGATLIPATLVQSLPGERARISVAGAEWTVHAPSHLPPGPALLCLRPHDLSIAGASAPGLIQATVSNAHYQGSHWLVQVQLSDGSRLEIEHRGEPRNPNDPVGIVLRDGWVVR